MEFSWDSANVDHIARHEVLPEEAEQVLQNEPFDAPATYRNGEMRTAHLGETDTGRLLFVVVTQRNGMSRVVTARDAHRKERAFYLKKKVESDDEDS